MLLTPPAFVLQFDGFPVGVEALVLALLTFVIPVFLALWVLIDAKEQTDHPLAWGLTVLLGGLTPFYVGAIAVTVLYHLSREELGSIPPPAVGNRTVGGEVLGESAREREGVESDREYPNATTAPAPRHEEQHGSDTVTGMGPDGQARWEGRADAGLDADAADGSESADRPEETYDEATSMGEGEWSEDESTEETAANRETPSGESDDPELGGFEMADPVEGDEREAAGE